MNQIPPSVESGLREMGSRLKGISYALTRRYLEYRYHLRQVPPCYYIVNNLSSGSVMIDLGTGHDADLSQYLILEYGLRSFGFDPTRKHHPDLNAVVRETKGRFQFYPYALSGSSGVRKFFESEENVSGSFASDHLNIRRDTVTSYDVRTVTLGQVFDLLRLDHVDLLKMDIEGEEYDALSTTPPDVLRRIGQLVVEFHHHYVDHITRSDTDHVVSRLCQAGFRPFTTDKINYLFFRKGG